MGAGRSRLAPMWVSPRAAATSISASFNLYYTLWNEENERNN